MCPTNFTWKENVNFKNHICLRIVYFLLVTPKKTRTEGNLDKFFFYSTYFIWLLLIPPVSDLLHCLPWKVSQLAPDPAVDSTSVNPFKPLWSQWGSIWAQKSSHAHCKVTELTSPMLKRLINITRKEKTTMSTHF